MKIKKWIRPTLFTLGGVLAGTRRMTRIIGSLKKSAERPSLMRYALGQDVLKLEDDSHD